MNFVKHSELEGLHAPFSPSQSAWLRYDDDKAISVYRNKNAAAIGSKLHEWAKTTIDLGRKQPRSKDTLCMYINDAIGFRMSTEVVLFYSSRFFGTTDAICFRKNVLRIHDYKSGVTRAHMDQLMIYAALFCLEYRIDPTSIKTVLRIYQSNDIDECVPEPEDIKYVMEKIIHLDKLFESIELEEM